MEKDTVSSQLWFTVRWITGYFLDLVITAGGAVAMVWSLGFYMKNPIHDIPLFSNNVLAHPLVAFGVGLGVFAAFMSGRQWVRTQFITHIIPEVWNDAVQNFIKSAKKDDKTK